MKLLTGENNVNALKIVIAAKLSKKSLTISEDSSATNPQLLLESGTCLISSNAAAKYLFRPSKQDEPLVNYYLDLEATVIQPLCISFNSKLTDQIKSNFTQILQKLNQELETQQYLSGDKLNVADVIVWSTLYPLFTDSKINKDFFESKIAVKKWFENIGTLTAVQDARKSYSVKEGLSSLLNLGSFQCLKNTELTSILKTEKTDLQKKVSSNTNENLAREIIADVTEEEKNVAQKTWSQSVKKSLKSQQCPVLPVPGEKNILITSALPYVNNVPHLGNIIGCVLSADVFARYCRLRGYNTLYICGTDEYGTATETKAIEEGLSPSEICDKYFKTHKQIYEWFNINFDCFGRTTTPIQTQICQDIFKKVYDNGYILSKFVEQLLCEKCDRFLADRFVEGTCPRCNYDDARGDQCDGCGHLINATELVKPRCKLCQNTPILQQSKQFFLDLPKIEPLLKEWITKTSTKWSHNAREISKAWLNEGLKPRCITRDLKWGIPVPLEGFQNKVFYVWFDAPIGYISITKTYTDEWEKWWMPDTNTKVTLYQFMAKDNVPFHSVMFPSTLLATKKNYLLVDNIFATEYLNYEDGKFSKSRGVGVFGNDAQDTGIPADVWRFYLLYVRPESQDSSFSWSDLALKNNSELLNILGNFINRSLMFCEKYYDSKVPNMNLINEDHELIALVNRELINYIKVLEKGKLKEGIRHLLSVARLGNQIMQSSQPWVLCKGTDDDKSRCGTVIGLSINLSCLLAQLLDPYMPETANTIRQQLNSPPEANIIEDKFRMLLFPGHQIGKPFPLFNKIEDDRIEELKARFGGRQKSKSPSGGDVKKSKETKEAPPSVGNDVASLEAAVAAQGNVVRKMKEAGKTKDEWGPQVTVLLDLKKKLAEAQANAKETIVTPANAKETVVTPANDVSQAGKTVEQLEDEVKKQGDKVRKMKESGCDKSQWQPEVNILLELKSQLATLKGEPLPTSSGKKNKKK